MSEQPDEPWVVDQTSQYAQVVTYDLTSKDPSDMSSRRLASTVAGSVFAFAGSLMAAYSVAELLALRAYKSAVADGSINGGGSPYDGFLLAQIVLVAFVLALVAVFSVLHAAKVPSALAGAGAIVALTFVFFYGVNQTDVDPQSLQGAVAYSLIPLGLTTGFVKWATR